MRFIEVKNFRNLGLIKDRPMRFELPCGGGLSVILGENNSGKSNLLSAINVLGNHQINIESDLPNNGARECEISYCERNEGGSKEVLSFESKEKLTICLNSNALEVAVKKSKVKEEEFYTNVNNILANAEIWAFKRNVKGKDKICVAVDGVVYCCNIEDSVDTLQCVHVDNRRDKNTHAVLLKCKVEFVTSPLEGGRVVNALKDFLDEHYPTGDEHGVPHEKRFSVAAKDEEGMNADKKKIEEKIEAINNAFRYLIDHSNKLKQQDRYAFYDNSDSALIKKAQSHCGYSYESIEKLLESGAQAIKDYDGLYSMLKDRSGRYGIQIPPKANIKTTIGELGKLYKNPEYAAVVKNECEPPKVIRYSHKELSSSTLECYVDNFSDFFTRLFDILEVDMEEIEAVYKTTKAGSAPRRPKEKEISNKLESLAERFNEIFPTVLEGGRYTFEVRLGDLKLNFEMFKNGNPIVLEEQSDGFRTFFGLFFGFLHAKEDLSGAIVLIDEAETHLSIPAQRKLREFLKDFGRERNILFIITTHSPYMIDIEHLDEIRIVMPEDEMGSKVKNDFSMIESNEVDTLKEIRKALGVRSSELLDEALSKEGRVIFVEGITDYNYLTGFKKILERKGKKFNFYFLPIGGLGANDKEKDGNPGSVKSVFSKEQKEVAKGIVEFSKKARISALVLVDNDESGKAFCDGVGRDFQGVIDVITLDVVGAGEIEELFMEEERQKFELDKKSHFASSAFKAMAFDEDCDKRISKQSIGKFQKLFEHLAEYVSVNSRSHK